MEPLDNNESSPWRRRTLAALAGIAVLFGMSIVTERAASDAMRRAEAKVTALGSSLDPREVASPVAIEGENAHRALEAARRFMKDDDKTLYRELHKRLQREILKNGAKVTAEDIELFRRALDHYDPVLEILDSAASTASARFEYDPDRPTGLQLPYLNASEHFADLLSARAHIAFTEGRLVDAWRDVRAILRIAAWNAEEMPTLVSQAIAVTAIDNATLEAHALLRGRMGPEHTEIETEAEIEAVLEEARRLDLPTSFDLALEMERAEMVTWLRDKAEGPALIRRWFPRRNWLSIPFRSWRTLDLAHYAESMTDFIAQCRRPAFERPEIFGHPGRLEAHYPVPIWAPLTRALLNEHFTKVCDKRDYALASLDLMEIALHLDKLRRTSGSYPPTLEALGAIPIDPFSGKPYGYRLTESGAVLYSFGIDRDDDGGESHPNLPNGDWNFHLGDRVWFLDSRGL